jgi:large subunit ribosomal protein L22
MHTPPPPKPTRREKIAQGLPKAPGNRKARRAETLRLERQDEVRAELRNYPSSPRKMRLVADLVRGRSVGDALAVLQITNKYAAQPLEKLIRSAIDVFNQKFEEERSSAQDLVISEIFVDGGRQLKRLRPAPQGRAYRVRKRSHHVTVYLAYPPTFDSTPDA